jgi:phosphatidate cytidylyltransferase
VNVAGLESAPKPGDAGPRAAAPVSNLLLRVASAAVLAPLAVATAYAGGWLFDLFWCVAAILVLWEWIAMVVGRGHRLMFSSCASALAIAALVGWREQPLAAILLVGLGALAALIFAPRGRRVWVTGGIVYAGIMLLAPLLLRRDAGDGFLAIVFLFAVVWTTDVLGYFGGRAFGGPKLAPAVSPKKTWSGAVAGALGATVAAVGGAAWLGLDMAAIALVALLLSVAAQLGDLLESAIKRRFGVKDASQLIPGHGGVMDRLDGFWGAALVGCLIGLAHGGIDGAAGGLMRW